MLYQQQLKIGPDASSFNDVLVWFEQSSVTSARYWTNCYFNAGPSSATLAQLLTNIVLTSPNKHGAFTQCCFNVGPSSSTLAQHRNSIGWTPRVCWAGTCRDQCSGLWGWLCHSDKIGVDTRRAEGHRNQTAIQQPTHKPTAVPRVTHALTVCDTQRCRPKINNSNCWLFN